MWHHYSHFDYNKNTRTPKPSIHTPTKTHTNTNSLKHGNRLDKYTHKSLCLYISARVLHSPSLNHRSHTLVTQSNPLLSMAANTISPVSVSPENDDCGGGTDGKKPVWSKPGVASSPVMGAVSWPALGESPSKGLMKTESLETVDGVGVGPALQVVSGNSSPSSHKQTNANNVAPARQKPMKRGGGSFKSNVSTNGGASHTSSTNQDLVVDNPQHPSGKPGTAGLESSPRDNTHVESRKGGHNGNDHQHHPSYRRSNSGQHSRGDGSNHYSNGGKRDQDRGNNEWNQHSRSFNGRDTNVTPQRGYARGYVRLTVHAPAPYISQPMPLPVRPFGNSMIYPELPAPVFYVQGPPPPPEALRAMPMVGPVAPPMYFTSPDHLLHARIASQIDYYFSNENLVRDTYLRKNMDEQGWVPVSLIACFKKVKNLTDNVQQVLDAMRASTIVEVQGDRIRRRNDWMRWLMQPLGPPSNQSSPQADGRSSNEDVLASQLRHVTLDNGQQLGYEDTGHVGGQ